MRDRPLARAAGAIFFGAFDFGFLTIAGPAIDGELRLGSAYAWLFGASAFAFAAALTPAGVAVARAGAVRVQRAGSGTVVAGLALCALAQGAPGVFGGRVLVGLGGALVAPAAWATIAAASARHGGAFALSGVAVALGYAGGVGVGGAAEVLGWRACLGVVALPLLPALLAPSARGGGAGGRPAAGVARLTAGIVLLAAGLAALAAHPVAGAAAVVAGAAAGAAGVAAGARARWLPRGPRTYVACAVGAGITASGVGATVLLGRALVEVAGRTASGAALLMVAFGAVAPAAAAVAARLPDAGRAPWSAALGLGLQAAPLLALALVGLAAPAVVAALAVAGLGHALASAGVAELVLAEAGAAAGPAASLLAAAQYVGSGAGAVVVLGIVGEPLSASGVRAGLAAAGAIGLGAGLVAVRGTPRHAPRVSHRDRARA
jgi:hypothetical protein